MLRITESALSDNGTTLILEGQVIGPWVAEVRKSCDPFLTNGHQLKLNLAEVSFVDRDGVILFQELMAHQVTLLNCSPFLKEQLKAIGPQQPQ